MGRLKLAGIVFVMLVFSACKKGASSTQQESKLEAKTYLNVAYGNNTSTIMDVYLPANRTTNTSVVIFAHGGSFIGGDKNDYSTLAIELANKGFAVLNVNYQLVDADGLYDSPVKHKKSAVSVQTQVSNLSLAVDFAIAKAKEWQVSESKIALAGHSAGATLALLYAYDSRNAGKIKVIANLAGALDQTFTDIPSYQSLLPASILEAGFRYTGYEATVAKEQYYKAISPLSVANANQKIPTLTVFPELNAVGVLPKQNRATFDAFTTKLNSLAVPNKFVQIAGAAHELSRPADLEIVINEMVAYFNANLK